MISYESLSAIQELIITLNDNYQPKDGSAVDVEVIVRQEDVVVGKVYIANAQDGYEFDPA